MRGASCELLSVRNKSEPMLRLFRFDDPEHGEATRLLPWLVNDTLQGAERARVERHLAQCAACRHEMENLRVLQACIVQDEGDPLLQHRLERINARLDGVESAGGPWRVLLRVARQWWYTNPWMRGAFVAPAAILMLLTVGWLIQPAPQYYRTLGASPLRANPDAQIVVVFNDALPERELRGLILRLNARIVDGPSPTGAYTLQVMQGARQAALAALRQDGAVIFAEPAPPAAKSPQ